MYKIGIKKVHFKKRTLVQWLTLWIFVLPFFLNCLISFFKLPSILKYTVDVAWVGILILTLMKSRLTIKKSLFPMACISLVFFLYTLVIYGFRFQSVAYYLWGFRNNFRYYVAFFAFTTFFTEEDVKGCFRFMDIIFWVNVVVSIVQFFLGYRQDYLGGIFGVDRGCNSSTLILFCVVLTKSILVMMRGGQVIQCVLQLLAASVIAALAELKVFYLMLVVILVMAAIMTKFSWKKCMLAIILVACFSLGSSILVNEFGISNDLTLENILNLITAENYSTKNDLSRFNAIPILSRTILRDTVSQWIGLGLGNCDTSAFSICNTPFYQAYSHLHYTWFSSSMLYLETGYIGLILYLSFFIACLTGAVRQVVRKGNNELYCYITAIMSVLCVMFTIYNSSLRTDIGYVAYFALSLPYISHQGTERLKRQ